LENAHQICNKIKELIPKIDDKNISNELRNELTKQMHDYSDLYIQKIESSNKLLNEINTISNDNISVSESVINPINDLIIEYKEFLSTLSLEQIAVICNLFPLFMILVSFFTITTITFNNFLIQYFKLEDKFPRIFK
jgi:hypothetical protein